MRRANDLRFNVRFSRLSLLFSALVYRALLDINYAYVVSPFFDYMGLAYSPDALKILESWTAYVALSLLVRPQVSRPSSFFANLNLFLFFAPFSSIYGLNDGSRPFFYAVFLVSAFAFIAARVRRIRIKTIGVSPARLQVLSIGFVAMVAASLVSVTGISNFSLVIGDEYLHREMITAALGDGLINYLLGWTVTVVGPAALLLSLIRKRYWWAALLSIFHVALFGLTSHKTPAMIPFVVIGLWWLRGFLQKALLLPVIMSSMALISSLVYLISGSYFLNALLVRRIFFVPPMLAFSYQEFFESRPKLMWASVMGRKAPFQGELSDGYENAVGNFLGTGGHANAGFFATGYLNAGYLGMLIYGFMFLALLILIDSVSTKRTPLAYTALVLLFPISVLITSADFLTALLTHGLAVGLLMAYLGGNAFNLEPPKALKSVRGG